MSVTGKSEVNLEISAGFFRIATDSLVYNITVLDDREPRTTRKYPQVVAEARPHPIELTAPEAAPASDFSALSGGLVGEDFYKQVSTDIFNDIGKLAKSLSTTMGDIPLEDRRMKRAELDEAGEKIENAKTQLYDIVSMTEKATMEIMDQVEKVQAQTDGVRELLLALKTHQAFQTGSEEGDEEAQEDDEPAGSNASLLVQSLREKIAAADGLLCSLREEGGNAAEAEEAPPAPVAPEPMVVHRTRHLFAIDTVLQTMYELCTNETVKSHISAARKNVEGLFDYNVFVDAMGERISGLEPDSDNFYTVPLAEVLDSLRLACSDPKIQNLFKKMNLNQAEIFLDQSLPLEAPATEEVEELVAGQIEEPAGDSAPTAAASDPGRLATADPRFAELGAMLGESLALVNDLEHGSFAGGKNCRISGMSLEDQREIFCKIEDAFQVTSSITEDVSRINEALSFQDLSGQQILKIIKLLSDFQVQLLAIVVSFGSQLKMKEQNASISVEESKRCAQEDVDRYLKSMTTEEVNGDGTLDQDAVNSLLADLGF